MYFLGGLLGSILEGSTLLNINNGADKPYRFQLSFLVPRSQFVLTVGVKGLTGNG